MKPRCGKSMARGAACTKSAGHCGHCEVLNIARRRARGAAWRAANPKHGVAWRAANPERVAANNAAWYTANPERGKAQAAAWAKANPERKKANDAAWGAANPARKQFNNASWAAANPEQARAVAKKHAGKRRAVKAQAPVIPWTRTEYAARMSVFSDACYYCALLGKVGPHENDDHVFPLIPKRGQKGGGHNLRNIVPSCALHNFRKNNKPPMEFIVRLLAC